MFSTFKNQNKYSDPFFWFSFLTLTISFSYIIYLILDVKSSWVMGEALNYKFYIMKYIPLNRLIPGMFNHLAFEFSDRITRPLSSAFEIIDTHFREWLWHYIPPISSLSLTFLFSLILGPWLFYKFLLNIKIRPSIALLAVSFMLLHPGSLSLIVMLFRPAKAMMNFWLIFSLYIASLIHIRDTQTHYTKNNLILCTVLSISIILGALFDETAVVIVTGILFLFPYLFFRPLKRVFIFISVPIILLALYFYILPLCAIHFGYPKPYLLTFSVFDRPLLPSFKVFLTNYSQHVSVMVRESFALFNPKDIHNFWERSIIVIYLVCLIVFISQLLMLFLKTKNETTVSFINKAFLLKSFFLFLALCLVHTVLLDLAGSKIDGRIWGPYWYGAYFGIFLAIFLGSLGETTAQAHKLTSCTFGLVVGLVSLSTMITFPYTNFFYRVEHYYSVTYNGIYEMYCGRINRFKFYNPNLFDSRKDINKLWKAVKTNELIEAPHRESLWVPIEMNVFK